MADPNMMPQGKTCRCPHHMMVPLLIALFGLDFLLGNWGWGLSADFVSKSWPVLVLLAGLMKISEGRCKCC